MLFQCFRTFSNTKKVSARLLTPHAEALAIPRGGCGAAAADAAVAAAATAAALAAAVAEIELSEMAP